MQLAGARVHVQLQLKLNWALGRTPCTRTIQAAHNYDTTHTHWFWYTDHAERLVQPWWWLGCQDVERLRLMGHGRGSGSMQSNEWAVRRMVSRHSKALAACVNLYPAACHPPCVSGANWRSLTRRPSSSTATSDAPVTCKKPVTHQHTVLPHMYLHGRHLQASSQDEKDCSSQVFGTRTKHCAQRLDSNGGRRSMGASAGAAHQQISGQLDPTNQAQQQQHTHLCYKRAHLLAPCQL